MWAGVWDGCVEIAAAASQRRLRWLHAPLSAVVGRDRCVGVVVVRDRFVRKVCGMVVLR